MRKQRIVLRQVGERALVKRQIGRKENRIAELNPPGVGMFDSRQARQHRALARARSSEQRDALSLIQAQAHVHSELAAPLYDMRLKGWHRRGVSVRANGSPTAVAAR